MNTIGSHTVVRYESGADKLALLNTSIITSPGIYCLRPISLAQAQDMLRDALSIGEFYSGVESAIGHDATAQIMSELLEVKVELNRIYFEQKRGQDALVFKLRGRIPEGQILDRAQIDEIGFDFFVLERRDGKETNAPQPTHP